MDQNKVRDTISFIGSLEAIEFITESKPTSAEMKTWGFDHPELELALVEIEDFLKGQKDWHGVFAAGKDQVHRGWLEATGKVVKISPADVQKLIAFDAMLIVIVTSLLSWTLLKLKRSSCKYWVPMEDQRSHRQKNLRKNGLFM